MLLLLHRHSTHSTPNACYVWLRFSIQTLNNLSMDSKLDIPIQLSPNTLCLEIMPNPTRLRTGPQDWG